MRTVLTTIVFGALALAATAASAQPGMRRRVDPVPRTLSVGEVEAYVAPYAAETRDCFLRYSTRGGELRLDLIVHRDGSVFRLQVDTPGAPPRVARAIDKCLQRRATRWHFPVRMGFTHAVVPFYFQKTRAPGAGPQPSCWSRRGCRTR